MEIKKIGNILDSKRLLRKFNFPMLMPVIKYNMDNGGYYKTIEVIKIMIKKHLEKHYKDIINVLGFNVSRWEMYRAFLYIIKRDFILKGIIREKIALEFLKKYYPSTKWNNDVNVKIESQGIDITGNGNIIGVSVKGPNFKNCKDFEAHKEKLIKNSFKRTFMFCVDEKEEEIKYIEEIKDEK